VSPDGYDIRYEGTFIGFTLTEAMLYTSAAVPTEYAQGSLYTWAVRNRSEMKWKFGCKQTRQQVVSRKGDVLSVKKAQIALLVFGVFSFIFLSLLFPCIEVFGSKEAKEKNANFSLGCKVVIKLAIIICTIVTTVIAAGTNGFWSAINESGGCSDPLTNETFSVLGRKFADLSTNNYITIAASCFTAFVDIASSLYKKMKA